MHGVLNLRIQGQALKTENGLKQPCHLPGTAIDLPGILCYYLAKGKIMGIEELKKNRDKIYAIASKYGAKHVRIFGSVATGKTSSNSDIDFLVDLAPGRSLFDLGGLLMDLHDLLGCEVDVVTEKGLRDRIRERVLKEAVPL
jgi:uncharacterized protein